MRTTAKTVPLLAAVLGAVLLPTSPAYAAVGVSTQLTVPIGFAVGQSAAGSVTFTNTNTVPHQAESNTLTSLRLTPSCGSSAFGDTCIQPDPGAFTISAATGAAGTACAGVSFTVSEPDSTGTVTLTPSAPVVLAPPGGAVGSDRCTVNFTVTALKMPAIDATPAQPGLQTFFKSRVELTGAVSGLSPVAFSSVQVTVVRATPTLTTQASGTVFQGGTISDTATVAGVANVPTPTGTVTFQVFGPNDATCTGSPVAQSTNALFGTTAQSDAFPVTQAGVYRFVATYSGDANYSPVISPCNAPNEAVTVNARRSVADFDGDGRSDLAVFRNTNATWFANKSGGGGDIVANFGLSGDIPVPGDYDGDNKADLGVFRNGTWFVAKSAGGTIAGNFGIAGDIPVPGDYDGDGRTDIAVWRPSNGTWYVLQSQGGTRAGAFGFNGDIPVPADYDGDGRTDFAVWRPSTGTWFILRSTGGVTSANWGTNGDRPVTGDYDGDGKADLAVFRNSTGTWFILKSAGGQTVGNFGISGDLPVPADYDADGKTDLAVWRPSNGTWFVAKSAGGTIAGAYGVPGDTPVAIPAAIRLAFP